MQQQGQAARTACPTKPSSKLRQLIGKGSYVEDPSSRSHLRCRDGQLMSSGRGAGSTRNKRCMMGFRLVCAAMAAASWDLP